MALLGASFGFDEYCLMGPEYAANEYVYKILQTSPVNTKRKENIFKIDVKSQKFFDIY